MTATGVDHSLSIDDSLIRWAVGGRPASREEALHALTTKPLLLLMHGYGSFEGDLIELAPRLPEAFVCASPRAPLVAPAPIENGYAWWQLQLDANGLPARTKGPAEFEGSGPHQAAVALGEWLDALDAEVAAVAASGAQGSGAAGGSGGAGRADGLGIIVPMGFSQGGCMVTSLMRMHPERFMAGVNCSGFVAPGTFAGDAALAKVKPPLFWGRDPQDPIIDEARIQLTQTWAPQHTELTARLYDGILHGIGAEELDDISAFLLQQLASAATS